MCTDPYLYILTAYNKQELLQNADSLLQQHEKGYI